jgi:hypothetical protein
MKSFTDLFISRPVLAIVVNLVIIIAGRPGHRHPQRAPVSAQRQRQRHGHHRLRRRQRRPGARLHHHPAGARHRRGRRHRLPGIAERPGLSTISARLKLNYDADQGAGRNQLQGRSGARRPAARSRGPGHQHRVGRQPVRLGLSQLHLGYPAAERNHRLPGAGGPAAALGRWKACSAPRSWAPAPSPCASGSSRTRMAASTSARCRCVRRWPPTTISPRSAAPRDRWFRSTSPPTPICARSRNSRIW